LSSRRVLVVHELVGGFGGAERYLELLGPALAARGVGAPLAVFGARDGREENAQRLRAAFAGGATERGTATPWALRRIVRAERPDLIHWNLFEPFIFRGGTIAALPWGRPSIITDHLPMMRDGRHYELTRRLANRRFAAMIVVGEAGADAARAHWRHLPPLRVVRNGIEVSQSRRREPPADGGARLLFVGRLEAQKNPLFARRVLETLRARGVNAELRFVGDGGLASQLGGDGVELTGFVGDVTPYLLDAHLLLSPAEFEGLPLAPIEALATGLPVLASDIPPHRELAAISRAVQVLPAGDPEAWVERVVAMLGELAELSTSAIAARESFSVDRMVDETIAVYEEVLRG
jgi:glycosyltransferase involved in cell wall biosynthesis